MGTTILWALLTGGVTGGVWVTIVLLGRQRRLSELHAGLREELEQRVEQAEGLAAHLEKIEERLDFTERILVREREAGRISSPGP